MNANPFPLDWIEIAYIQELDPSSNVVWLLLVRTETKIEARLDLFPPDLQRGDVVRLTIPADQHPLFVQSAKRISGPTYTSLEMINRKD
jgi:hypothetical protein